MDNQTLIAAIVVIALIIIVISQNKKESKSDGGVFVDPAVPTNWEIGPNMNGVNPSKGVPLNPVADPRGLFRIDIPFPNAEAGHVHYVTMPCGPLVGKKRIRAYFQTVVAPGADFVPAKEQPGVPSIISLYFQRKGDDWSAVGSYEAYRWYAVKLCPIPTNKGFTIEASLEDGNWTAVMGSSRENNPQGFRAALADTGRVGFVLGGGDGLGHGVYATGPAELVLQSYDIE